MPVRYNVGQINLGKNKSHFQQALPREIIIFYAKHFMKHFKTFYEL